MKFQYFTFLLNPTEQGSIFPEKRDKIEILRSILTSETIVFDSRKVRHAFVVEKAEDDFIIAKFGRRSSIKRHLSPQDQFAEKKEEDWPYSWVIINLSTDPKTGQRIAFEHKTNVFDSPFEQLKNFADAVNSTLFSSGYAVSINPITIDQEFWKLVETNSDRIERLSFTFNAPNLFQLGSTLENDLRASQKDYGLTKATIEFENPTGKLRVPHTELMEQAVDYIARGGGEYSLKIKGAKHYEKIKSSKKILTKSFDDIEVITSDQKSFMGIIKEIFKDTDQ